MSAVRSVLTTASRCVSCGVMRWKTCTSSVLEGDARAGEGILEVMAGCCGVVVLWCCTELLCLLRRLGRKGGARTWSDHTCARPRKEAFKE